MPTGFNGGPSNRSAKPRTITPERSSSMALQWRAEQSLGQTKSPSGALLPSSCSFNGGPSNRSAKPTRAMRAAVAVERLQWRAEQSLGQTSARPVTASVSTASFNGGPSNRSAKRPELAGVVPRQITASMEGPSNRSAKPPRPSQRSSPPSSFNGGPSNRSAKPGWGWSTTTAKRCFNGGPSNRSAKPVLFSTLSRTGSSASMEGRAIARPNDAPHRHIHPCQCWLQWRAEQSLGQTRRPAEAGARDGVASMEGRAIARPNTPRRSSAA